MKCSQCQAELPDSATICPRCGTPRQQGQPMTTFSYLPAGTPPWPTAVPPRHTYWQEPAVSAPAGSSSSNQKEKSGRSARSILLAVAILVLVPILGSVFTLTNLYFNGDLSARGKPAKATSSKIQSTPNVQQTPGTSRGNQLPAPTSFSKTSDKDLNVSIKYPSDWQADAPNKSTNTVAVSIYPSQKYVIFVVERYSATASSQITNANELNQATLQGIASQLGATGVQTVTLPNPKPTIGGANWDEMDVTFSDSSSGAKGHLASISVLHSKSYYNIAFLMPDSVHDEAMQKYIQPMLDSLQFLS